jgi:adenine-specific DNA-methyltransferase
MAKKSDKKPGKRVETLRHTDEKRRNIPTAEHQSVVDKADAAPREVRYPRNTDLDPQLVWRGKDYQDWTDLVVSAPPIYIQEKIQPKVLIDDLMRESRSSATQQSESQIDLFGDFNGIPEGADKTDFYKHDQNWSNRMILGDSLQVMASLAEREGLRGKVQCIYFDPPYGIKFNSNFQWSTTSRDVKDGNAAHITREPEQVKAFRDTWKDGIHSYLTYLRDRLTVARALLTESGSIFVQIGDENVHRVRSLLDEVFGAGNFICELLIRTTAVGAGEFIGGTVTYVLFYARDRARVKYRPLFVNSGLDEDVGNRYTRVQTVDYQRRVMNDSERTGTGDALAVVKVYRHSPLSSQSGGSASQFGYSHQGLLFRLGKGHWKTNLRGMESLSRAWRLGYPTRNSLAYVRFVDDFPATPMGEIWTIQSGAFTEEKVYVVQTNRKVVERCLLMATDPGDLVLDPTCGSGTTAIVSEQWGRRWITVDTSRVALALARTRIVGARLPFYLLADSQSGLRKEAEVSGRTFVERPTHGSVRQGFVYERVPHVTLKSIANNAEIDVIYQAEQPKVQDALDRLNAALKGHKTPFRVTTGGREGKDVKFNAPADVTFTMPSGEVVSASALLEWEVPRDFPSDWPAAALRPLNDFWAARIARQKAIDASIAAKAEFEFLYDRPYEDKKIVRVSGPFTVESLSPHRTLNVDADDELIDPLKPREGRPEGVSFEQMILENLKTAGVQQADKAGRITFSSLVPWPGELICGEGKYRDSASPSGAASDERRAAIFIGPEFGTVGRADLVKAAREAGDAGFDVLIACAFNYEAHASEFSKLGRIPVLKARMNADLHMAGELKATGTGNLFVIFGEPDIDILHDDDDRIRVHVKGVDVFDPSTGEVRSDGADGIACWFIDTDYNEESFFVRHAYFLGQNDPYSALRTTLKAEINVEAWETLHSDVSRPFEKPSSGRIAVKVINHLGDEVMKVFRVD